MPTLSDPPAAGATDALRIARGLPALLAAAALAWGVLASPVSARPIEAYAAPPSTFPVEGGEAGFDAAPLPVHDASRRRVVGTVRSHRPCRDGACLPEYELKLVGGDTLAVEVGEWSYETRGLVTYRAPLPGPAGRSWIALDTTQGLFWTLVATEHVHRFETLVSVVEEPAVWCDTPRQCRRVTPAEHDEMRRVAAQTSCFGTPYEVLEVIEVGPQRFYVTMLPEPMPAGVTTFLAQRKLVPTRNARGEHTGTFYSRGC